MRGSSSHDTRRLPLLGPPDIERNRRREPFRRPRAPLLVRGPRARIETIGGREPLDTQQDEERDAQLDNDPVHARPREVVRLLDNKILRGAREKEGREGGDRGRSEETHASHVHHAEGGEDLQAGRLMRRARARWVLAP
jgi:hypothetical protein